MDKVTWLKLRISAPQKILLREYKDKPQNGSKYLANYILDIGLVFRMYKEWKTQWKYRQKIRRYAKGK